MTNILKALKWRICGSYNPYGPVTEDGPDRARNRALYEVWKYNTFGLGSDIFRSERTYEIVESGTLHQEPLYLNDPWYIAAMASIIAELEGRQFISIMTPVGLFRTEESVKEEEARAIDHMVEWYAHYSNAPHHFKHAELSDMLEKLKQYNNPK